MKILIISALLVTAACGIESPEQKCVDLCEALATSYSLDCGEDQDWSDRFTAACESPEGFGCDSATGVGRTYDQCLTAVQSGEVGCNGAMPQECVNVIERAQ